MRKPEQEPLEKAYVALREKLAGFARSYKVSEDDVNDALQESYLRLQDRDMGSNAEARGTLFVTLRRIIIDRLRALKRKAAENVEDIVIVDESYEDKDIASEEELMSRLREGLTPLQFEIMRLLVIEDLDYHEIAKQLNMSEGAIRTNVCRARKTIKERLNR